MHNEPARTSTLPVPVLVTALLVALYGVWQLAVKAWPALAAGEPGSEWIGVAFSAALVWGLLQRRAWARSWTLFMAGAGVVVAAAALALLQEPGFAAHIVEAGYDEVIFRRMLMAVGLLSAASLVLLRTTSAKDAFGLR